MEFKDFMLNEKVSDLPKDLQDKYWKIIHTFNSWKKSRDPKKQTTLQYQMSQFKDVLKKYGVLDQKSMAAWDEKMNMVFGKTDVPDIKKRTPKPENSSNIPDETEKEPEQNDEDFNRIEIDQEFVEKAFNKFNQKYFNGVLVPIPIHIASSDKAAGCFASSTDLQNKKIIPKYIQLNPKDCNISFSSFRNTFVHEMLHYYVHCYMPLDPNPEINENIWNEALNAARLATFGLFNRNKHLNKVKKLLELSDVYSHSKRWLKLAKQLNSKYPELTITRNSFIGFNSNGELSRMNNQLETINKIKEASLYKITTYINRNTIKSNTDSFTNYKILLPEYGKIYDNFINESPINEEKFMKLHDDYDCNTLFGIGFLHITNVVIEKAPIIKPQGIIEFNVNLNELKPRQYIIDSNSKMFKQMKQAKIFGSFKKVGTINMTNRYVKNNTETESFDSFSAWVDKNNIITEKTISKGKKFTPEELEELGFTEDDIEALENGELDFDTSTV